MSYHHVIVSHWKGKDEDEGTSYHHIVMLSCCHGIVVLSRCHGIVMLRVRAHCIIISSRRCRCQ